MFANGAAENSDLWSEAAGWLAGCCNRDRCQGVIAKYARLMVAEEVLLFVLSHVQIRVSTMRPGGVTQVVGYPPNVTASDLPHL